MAKAKQSDLLPLSAIRQLLKSCTTGVQPVTHQVSALPTESDLEYYFVPAEHMELSDPTTGPVSPLKT